MGATPQAAGSLEMAAEAWQKAGENDRAAAARARGQELDLSTSPM
jgi:hypothetical protein